MNNLIRCFVNKTNGLLESPTGTGKTMCLLTSALGFLKKEREKGRDNTKIFYFS